MRRSLFLALAVVTPCLSLASPVSLKALSFDPILREPQIPARWQAGARSLSEPQWLLVQTSQSPSLAIQSALGAYGLAVEAYLPERTLLVRASLRQARAARTKGLVTWVGEFHPYYKLSPELGQCAFTTTERRAEQVAGHVRATVQLFRGQDVAGTLAEVRRRGIEVVRYGKVGPFDQIDVEGQLSSVKTLAGLDAVQWIEDSAEIVTRNDVSTWVVQSNVNGSRPIHDKGLKGQNMIVGLIDGAMYMLHNCFRDPAGNPIGASHRKVVYSSNGGSGSDSHGTHTAGTIAGDREPVNGQTANNGHAPKAKLAFSVLGGETGSTLYTKLTNQFNAGARDHSNSWGNDSTRAYTSVCQAIDQFSWDNEDCMVAFAVSNGSIATTPENAKSCLAVGATNQSPNQGTVGSGGTGPTQDGRRKPEIFAPGIGILSASSGTTDSFRSLSGTSMACPAVTGEATLIRQWFREGRYVEAGPSMTLGIQPSGALVRAMVMNSGVNMTGVTGYPSNAEGWGRMLVDNVLWFPGEGRRTKFKDVRRANGLVTGEARTFKVLVQDSGAPLRVTLSFTDYPAAINAANAWVNDVDLEVMAPSGTVYLGNVFNTSTGESVTGGTPDTRNSTEMVILNAPAPGVYTIKYRGTNIVQGGTQGCALVVNGNLHPLNLGG